MISVEAINKAFKLLRELLKLITDQQAAQRENFKDIIEPLYKDLEEVVREYHKVFTELERAIKKARSHDDIERALVKAEAARDIFQLGRATVLGELKGALHYEDKGGWEDFDANLIRTDKARLLWNFARSINELFKSPLCKVYTYLSYEFEEILRTRNIADVGERRDEICDTLRRGGIKSLTEAWEETARDFGELKTFYRRL